SRDDLCLQGACVCECQWRGSSEHVLRDLVVENGVISSVRGTVETVVIWKDPSGDQFVEYRDNILLLTRHVYEWYLWLVERFSAFESSSNKVLFFCCHLCEI